MNKQEMIKFLIKAGIEPNEAKSEVELILEYTLNKTKEELLFINDFDESFFASILEKRVQTKQPIQYILGFAPFMGQKFMVNNNVLIPRDETEILVRHTFSKILNGAKILDIGTGSGIIACMLGIMSGDKNLDVEILGIDISTKALNVAIENMENFNLVKKVMFRKSDIFSNIRNEEKFDIIVSNPPYIPGDMKKTIQREVLYEPDLALYTNDFDGLYFYKKIIKESKNFLKKGGYLLFEMMEGQADSIQKLFEQTNFSNIEIIKDLSGIKRVISANYI